MRATGIVRRIDDLGRVVIPREIRRSLRIREGDPLEIFVEGNSLCLVKYNSLEEHYKPYLTAMLAVLDGRGVRCAVYDRDGYRYMQSKHTDLPKEIALEELEERGLVLAHNGEQVGFLWCEGAEGEWDIIHSAVSMFHEILKATDVGGY